MKDKKRTLVSVVVTTYNRKEMLKITIKSILNQTYDNIELLIIDNYSNYDFFNFISSFNDSRIKAFQNKNNGIIAVNRNYGINKSIGNYIAFCDDDDYWDKFKLSDQIKFFKNEKVILVSSLALKIGKSTSFFSSNYGFLYPFINLEYSSFLETNPIVLSSVLICNNTIKSINGFSENPNIFAVEDHDLFIRLYKKGQFIILNRFHVNYRIHDNNFSENNVMDKIRSNKMLELRNLKLVNSKISFYKKLINLFRNTFIYILIKNFVLFLMIIKIKTFTFLSNYFNKDFFYIKSKNYFK
jgi:teichuronic acid biosynthesis glycosyltransferase TuaG